MRDVPLDQCIPGVTLREWLVRQATLEVGRAADKADRLARYAEFIAMRGQWRKPGPTEP